MAQSTDAQGHRSQSSGGGAQSCRSRWCGWIARPSEPLQSTAVSSNTRRTREWQFLIQALPVCLPHEFSLQLSGFRDPRKPGVLKLLEEGYLQARNGLVSLSPILYRQLSESCQADDDRAHRAFRACRSTSEQNDRFSQRPTTRCGIGGPPSVTFVAGDCRRSMNSNCCLGTLARTGSGKKGAHLLRYASSRGEIELRKAIAAYLCDVFGAPIVILTKSWS